MARKPHISHSQLDMYSRCGMQYWHRYIEGIKAPPSVAMLVGSGTHEAIEADLAEKMATGQLLQDEAIPDIAADTVNRRWGAEPPLLNEEEALNGEKKTKGEAVDRAIALAVCHHRDLAPELNPVAVEREWRVDVQGYPFELMGYIDVQEPESIRDTKTSKKSPDKNAASNSQQLTLYHLACRVLDKTDPVLYLDTLVSTKTPKVVTQTTTRTSMDHQRLLDRIAVMHDAVMKGVFTPAPEDAWCCSERWCGYWKMCPFGQKGRNR